MQRMPAKKRTSSLRERFFSTSQADPRPDGRGKLLDAPISKALGAWT
jgi:hypothetical protein